MPLYPRRLRAMGVGSSTHRGFQDDAIANRGGVWAPGRRWLSSFLGLGLQTAPALRRGYWRHTLGYFLPRRPTWRRLDPSSSPSASLAEAVSSPRDLVGN